MNGSALTMRAAHAVALGAMVAMAACGGGGDSAAGADPAGSPTVTAASVPAGPAKYGQKVVLTVNGSQLDAGRLVVSATGCSDVALSTTAPLVSNATTAYYQCTVSALSGGLTVKRASDSATLATTTFTAPVPQVTMTVSNGAGVNGTIVVTLAPDKTPITVDNFLAYVNAGFYDGTVFHRVAPGFVIQGGGYVAPVTTDTPTAKPTSAPIELEVSKGLHNTQWTIAMARTSTPASATSQFFINLVDNSATLDPGALNGAGYAVFGAVTGETAVVTAIVAAPCTAIPLFLPTGECTPSPNVVIASAVQTQ